MRAPDRDLAWLRRALQSAMELELGTLPPYLCGLWALKDQESDAALQIRSIALQEMGHFGLACNMLSATGEKPEVVEGYRRIVYPGPLPGGVVPACDGALIPCGDDFQVRLGFGDFKAFALMCATIEYPEDPVPRPLLAEAVETFPTIGEFYAAVLEAFHANTADIPYDTANQRKGSLGIFIVDSIDKAVAAIERIQQQGEGGSRNPFYGNMQLAHFYAFGELYFGKKYIFDAATETGDWTGAPVVIPANAVYQMTPVPAGGYPSPPPDVTDCDVTFTQMLVALEQAWSGGGSAALGKAVGLMVKLAGQAKTLLGQEIPRTDGAGIYGPQFRLAGLPEPVPGGGGGGGQPVGPVSFAADIVPLFRPVDIAHMKPFGVKLDNYAYMSDPADDHGNAKAVLDTLTSQNMPPGGPFWPQDKLDLFAAWMSGGYLP